MARKRNLEGTTSSFTVFFDLHVYKFKTLSSNMGVLANDISFGTFDMLKDLELASISYIVKKLNLLLLRYLMWKMMRKT